MECEEGWLIKQHKLDFQRMPDTAHVSDVVLQKLRELCGSWDISAVQSNPDDPESCMPIIATTDCGTNITKALEDAHEYAHVPCFAHKTHRVMICSVARTPWLTTALDKMLSISRNFNKSQKQKGYFLRYTRHYLGRVGTLPKTPCKTRWNSFADSVDRYVAIHSDLVKYAGSELAEAAGATVVQENLLGTTELANLQSV